MLLLNNITSLALVITCWWLAHLFSLERGLIGKLVAVKFAAVAMLTMIIALFRNMDLDLAVVTLVTKTFYLLLFIGLGVHTHGSKRTTH